MKKPSMRMVAAGVAALVVVLLVRSCGGGEEAAGPARTARVEQGPLVVTVRASGEILSRDANKIIPRIRRGSTVSFLVPEGTRVASNEVVARFAAEEIDTRITDGEAALADRELAVASTETDLEIQLLDNANTLALARQAVADAELELKKFTEGDLIKDRRAAELKIQTSASERERSVRKHTEAKELLARGFITEDQVEEERIAMETAAVDAETAALELRILGEYDLPLRRNKVEGGLEKARTELEKTEKKNEVQELNKRQALDNAVRMRDRAALELDNLRKEREGYEVRAPIDGVVTYGDPGNPWRRGEIQVGVNMNPGEVLMTIPDMRAMEAHVNVSEADVDKVKVGQTAQVYVEAMGRRTFDGAVVRVAEVANPGGWISSDVKEFKVQITIDHGDGLRPGFSCDAVITVDTVPEALLLPVPAVFREGDRWVVYRGSPERAEAVPVTIGRSSATHVQIIEGLARGDEVLLTPPEAAR